MARSAKARLGQGRWSPRRAATALLLLGGSGCLQSNYLDPDGPRYAADYRSEPRTLGSALRVVTYNLQAGEAVEVAIEALSTDPLADADVVLMQEMDADGVDRIAAAHDWAYVYYPADIAKGRDRGNAVLSAHAILNDAKILLPHGDPFNDARRTATYARLDVGADLHVYSTPIATPSLGLGGRLDQVQTVLEDAAPRVGPVVLGGDFNTSDFTSERQTRTLVLDGFGYALATPDVEFTGGTRVFKARLDFIFVRGLRPGAHGVFRGEAGSDHLPVWAEVGVP